MSQLPNQPPAAMRCRICSTQIRLATRSAVCRACSYIVKYRRRAGWPSDSWYLPAGESRRKHHKCPGCGYTSSRSSLWCSHCVKPTTEAAQQFVKIAIPKWRNSHDRGIALKAFRAIGPKHPSDLIIYLNHDGWLTTWELKHEQNLYYYELVGEVVCSTILPG